MNKKWIAVILIFLLINISCKKDKKAEVNVSQITQTDAFGNNTGTIDNTDWTKDNMWTDAEVNIFEAPASSQLANTKTALITNITGYPNPVANTIILYFSASEITLLQIVITDKFLAEKERHYYVSHTGNNLLYIALNASAYANNTNYRIYYSFYSLADSQYYKGHGDIKISR